MDDDLVQLTQPTQNVLDPRRVGKQNSGFSDDDISDIICLLVPASASARRELVDMATRDARYVVGRQEADLVEPNYDTEDQPHRFAPPSFPGDHSIMLRLSTDSKNPALGFVFGRNPGFCDIHFIHDPLRRLSNCHFRIFVNEHGTVMIEDQSTNGTLVDSCLLRCREGFPTLRTLDSGSFVRISLGDIGGPDLSFVVRIPRREGSYEVAYQAKLEDYFGRIQRLPPLVLPHISPAVPTPFVLTPIVSTPIQPSNHPTSDKTVLPDRDGHVVVFRQPTQQHHGQRVNHHIKDKFAAPLIPLLDGRPPTQLPTTAVVSPEVRRRPKGQASREWRGSGPYNRVCTIGKGAFAVVYKVTSQLDGVPYAAKELDKQRFVRNGVLDQKVENEMKIMQKIRHPHIVKYIEHFEWEESLVIIIMEFISGGDLGKHILVSGPLPERDVQTMADQMLSALEYLHTNNITHRDIKPDNILIKSLDPIDFKLSDFGLSKMVNDGTFLRTFCGTLLYCAPEVYSEYSQYDSEGFRTYRDRKDPLRRPATRQRYDHAVDVWSLGGVIFFTLTGKPPYPVVPGTTYTELLHQIMTTNLDTFPLAQRSLSCDGVEFLWNMLQRRPENRASIAQLQTHRWVLPVASSLAVSHDDGDAAPSPDSVTDDEALLNVKASQLSLNQGRTRSLTDDLGDDFSDCWYGSEKENDAGAGTTTAKLFGEVNASVLGSSGVVPIDRLNLPLSVSVSEASFRTELLDFEVPDSLGSNSGAEAGHRSSSTEASDWISRRQSLDELQSLIGGVASQSLGGGTGLGIANMPSTETSTVKVEIKEQEADVALAPTPEPSIVEFHMSIKRKPSAESDGNGKGIALKRRKSSGAIAAIALPELVQKDIQLLAGMPVLRKLESGRLIDLPVDKKIFWQSDSRTWHLMYPEMTQLQLEGFVQAARDVGGEFGPDNGSLYWDLAMRYFPPTMSTGVHSGTNRLEQDTKQDNKPGDRQDGKQQDAQHNGQNYGQHKREFDDLGIGNVVTRGECVGQNRDGQLVVPISQPARMLAFFKSDSTSAVQGIHVPVTDQVASWGRATDNLNVYTPRSEAMVPKYAFRVLLWRPGFEAKDSTKARPPWEQAPANRDTYSGANRAEPEEAASWFFYISSKATKGIWVNQFAVRSSEPRNPSSPSVYWVRLYDGDKVTVWGSASDSLPRNCLTFRCLWGGSAAGRVGVHTALEPPSTAGLLDQVCLRLERRVQMVRDRARRQAEAVQDLCRRRAHVERERARSQLFETLCRQMRAAMARETPDSS